MTKAAFKAEALDTYRQRLGGSVDVDPGEAMLALIGEAASNVMFYRSRIALLDQVDEADHPETQALAIVGPTTVDKLYEEIFDKHGDPTGVARPHVLVEMYNDERDRLGKLCEKAIALGLREREVRLAESQGRLIAQVIQSVLKDLDLNDDQAALVPAAVRKHLMALDEATA